METVEKRRLQFHERYRRVTTYVENGLHEEIGVLRSRGTVQSMTGLVNSALNEYLIRHFRPRN